MFIRLSVERGTCCTYPNFHRATDTNRVLKLLTNIVGDEDQLQNKMSNYMKKEKQKDPKLSFS